MASGFLVLLDDIATLMDDIAVMSKIAAKKSAGILGDDLALNAEQITGVSADRELPVVWAVAKGSLLNKLILIPLALGISAAVPWLIIPLLMFGGAYLCYEGFEKVGHQLLHDKEELKLEKENLIHRVTQPNANLLELEKEKIKGAIRTDFILSAEIVVLTLGLVAQMPFASRVGVLFLIGFALTVGVYGLVAIMVKIDDFGLYLFKKKNSLLQYSGNFILKLAPQLMKGLSITGTTAMFLVGGGIFIHGIPSLQNFKTESVEPLGFLAGVVYDGGVGLLLGAIAFLMVSGIQAIRKKL